MSSRESTLVLAPVRTLATTTTVVLLGAVCLAEVFKVYAAWHHYAVVRDDIAGVPGVGMADLLSAENTVYSASLLMRLIFEPAVIVVLVWLWRARRNAELINSARHRLGRNWTLGAWLCPVVQLWFPCMIVDDIWRASRPDVPNDLDSLHGVGHNRLVRYWWYSLLAAGVAALWLILSPAPDGVLPTLRDAATIHTALAVLLCLAGVSLSLVIRQVTRWQSIPQSAREDWRWA
jgi:hypothetical protein